MDAMRLRRARNDQTIVGVSLSVTVFCVFWLLLRSSISPGQGLSLQLIFLVGTFLTAVGLLSATWRRVRSTQLLGALLVVTGAGSLLLMTALPMPSIDPVLRLSGAWRSGPLPLAAGWDRYLMSGLLCLSGLTLPFALRPKARRWALGVLTLLRFCLWCGALWQLAWMTLGGGLAGLFAKDTANLQIGLLFAAVIGSVALLRGERGWMATLTGSDRSVALARFVAPVMLLPIVAALLLSLAVRQGAFSTDVATVMNAELSSIALLFVGLAAVRGIWLQRRRSSTLSRAVESSPVMIHSEAGVIESWPRGCETLFGYKAEETIGRRAPEVLHTEYPIPVAEIEAIIRRTGEWSGEVRQTARDGRRLWIATRIAADRPDADSELKLVETMTDITDLKLSAAILRDTADSLEQVISGYGLGMIEYRARSGRSRFSPQMEGLLGLERGALGSDQSVWATLLHPADVTRFTTQFMEDTHRKSTGRTITFKIMHRDGQYRDLQGVVRYEYDSDDRPVRVVGVYMDVTEILRDRVEVAARGARLLELQAELAHTSRLSAMGEMAAGLAHELNQPLTAVGNAVGSIEMLLRDENRPMDGSMRKRLLRAATHAENQAVRAGEIVRRLREFIARGEADTQVEDLDLLVDDSLALALPNPAVDNIEVGRSIDPAVAAVLADRIQVQQVLVNLIRNAVEAMRDQDRPGALSIIAEAGDGMALVRVIDNGGGVTDDGQSTLFSPFVSTKREGMGVGLSICRRIIEAHGGNLWFEPAEGGGAEFRFTLPLAVGEGRLEGG